MRPGVPCPGTRPLFSTSYNLLPVFTDEHVLDGGSVASEFKKGPVFTMVSDHCAFESHHVLIRGYISSTLSQFSHSSLLSDGARRQA
jgi:hypothetical protein